MSPIDVQDMDIFDGDDDSKALVTSLEDLEIMRSTCRLSELCARNILSGCLTYDISVSGEWKSKISHHMEQGRERNDANDDKIVEQAKAGKKERDHKDDKKSRQTTRNRNTIVGH